MNRRTKQALIGTGIAFLIIIIAISAAVIKRLTPGKLVMELTDYYKLEANEVMLIMQDKVYEKKGLLEDGTVYLDYDTVNQLLNKRFYWDANENVLSYTTPTEVIKAEVGKKSYMSNKKKIDLDYSVVKTKGDQVYVAIDFVKQFSDMRYKYYKTPNRVVIQYKWDDYLFTKVKKQTQLRFEPSIKSDILVQLEPDQVLTYVDTSDVVKGGFSKVMTEDGIIGYVKNKYVNESYYEAVKSDYKAPDYTHIASDETINMVWHQVTNQDANYNLPSLLGKTKGVTTISPTWFKVADNKGSITSLANETYVERAHDQGIEVWGLVDDFSNDINMLEVLSYTSHREKLINELIAEAIKYNLDGINIDFENIGAEAGIHYIEFIRELSVKCRNNDIVLSIDNYVPTDYSAYYDTAEQGEVADYVIIMAYDEHHGGSEVSGSVSSLGFVDNAINTVLENVSKERVIIAIPFYTRQWKEVTENGSTTVSSEAYSMANAENLLKDNGVEPVWDDSTGQFYGEYVKDGATYKIWMEEEDSIEAKMKLIDKADVAGVAAWKLGLEKENIWDVIIKHTN
jgi:spore germination protein YaaH